MIVYKVRLDNGSFEYVEDVRALLTYIEVNGVYSRHVRIQGITVG